jgi:hypothetical protein
LAFAGGSQSVGLPRTRSPYKIFLLDLSLGVKPRAPSKLDVTAPVVL